jgi:hypothetical protein
MDRLGWAVPAELQHQVSGTPAPSERNSSTTSSGTPAPCQTRHIARCRHSPIQQFPDPKASGIEYNGNTAFVEVDNNR